MMEPPMPWRHCAETLSATLLLFAVVLSACASEGPLRPFSTDGCSLFPDRSLIQQGGLVSMLRNPRSRLLARRHIRSEIEGRPGT